MKRQANKANTILPNLYFYNYKCHNFSPRFTVRMLCPITKTNYTKNFCVKTLGYRLAYESALIDLEYINNRKACGLPIHYIEPFVLVK